MTASKIFSTRLIAYTWLPALVLLSLSGYLGATVGDTRTVLAAVLTGAVICALKRVLIGVDDEDYGTEPQLLCMALLNSAAAAVCSFGVSLLV